ncbi:MAG: glycosyl transferase family 1 [Desulfobulbus propionicus]|nr:MAG: glycosyl transferase family 1 [Desulfobulbus propionicus]
MRIAFDHCIFSQQERGGISRYFLELAAGLHRLPGVETRVVAPLHMSEILGDIGVPVSGWRVPRIARTHRLRQRLNDLFTPLLCSRFTPDIEHRTYYTARRHDKIPVVLTVFDMIHERYPRLFSQREQTVIELKRQAIENADQVICISQATRDDLLNLLNVPDERVSVVHLGNSIRAENSCGTPPVTGPYLLYVGRRQGPKNFVMLLRAMAARQAELKEVSLVCFGGGPLNREELQLAHQLGIGPARLHQLEGDDTRLACLYRHAQALVYPSVYEGFGLPLVEAMASGCPVVCSRAGSMPEIAGEAACYFDPADQDAIAGQLVAVITDSELRHRLIEDGRERAQRFTWERCVRQTLEVYKRCLH